MMTHMPAARGFIIGLIHHESDPGNWVVRRWKRFLWFKIRLSSEWFNDRKQALAFAAELHRKHPNSRASILQRMATIVAGEDNGGWMEVSHDPTLPRRGSSPPPTGSAYGSVGSNIGTPPTGGYHGKSFPVSPRKLIAVSSLLPAKPDTEDRWHDNGGEGG
jgi:hypothetical protein